MIDAKATGKEIFKHMHKKRMNVSQLADRCYVTVQSVYKWIKGINVPNIESLLLLSKIFDCKIDDLIKEKKIDGVSKGAK